MKQLKAQIVNAIIANTKFVYTEAYYEACRFVGEDEVEPAVYDDINAAIEATSFSAFGEVHAAKVRCGYVIYDRSNGMPKYVTSTTELVWHAMNS